MAGVTGLEPAASGVTGRRSNQTELHPPIHYRSIIARKLWLYFLYYINSVAMVGGEGIEPPTYWV